MGPYLKISLVTLNIIELYKEVSGSNCFIVHHNQYIFNSISDGRFSSFYEQALLSMCFEKQKLANIKLLWNKINT